VKVITGIIRQRNEKVTSACLSTDDDNGAELEGLPLREVLERLLSDGWQLETECADELVPNTDTTDGLIYEVTATKIRLSKMVADDKSLASVLFETTFQLETYD